MKLGSPFLLLVVSSIAATSAFGQIDPRPMRLDRGPKNLYERPVVDRAQNPVEYTRNELVSQEAKWRAAGGTIPMGALGGCETTGARATWKWFDMGTGIGTSGFAVSDANGFRELIVSGGGFGFGGSRYWQILRFDPATAAYEQQFTSPVYDPGLARVTSGDFDGDGANEIIAVVDGAVEIWDQSTRRREGGFDSLADARAAKLVDVDRDGLLELVIVSGSATRAYAHDGTVVAAFSVGGSDFAVGQMDGDASLELALTSGDVVDVDSASIQWTNVDGFGGYVEAGDIDGDGYDEVIATAVWGSCWAFDVDTQLPKWSFSIFNVGATDLVDVDLDGELELIIGEAQWGDQLIYDLSSRTVEASIDNPEHGTTEVIAADADGDGVLEVIWGAGHTSTGPDHLFVGDWVTESHEWVSVDFDGPFRAPRFGDIDGDGVEEIVTVSNESDSGYGSGRILVFDQDTFAMEAVSQETAGGLGWSGTHEVELVDVDDDPELELFVATSRTYDGVIEAYDFDGTEFTLIWSILADFSSGAYRDIEVIDVDGDGNLEVVGSRDGRFDVYDFDTETLEWSAPFTLGSIVPEVEVGNVDQDPALEIIALASDGDLTIFDAETRTVEAILQVGATTVELADGVLGPDILRFGTSAGRLVSYRHDGSAFVEIADVGLASDELETLVLRGQQVVFTGVDGALRMYELVSGVEIWSSCRDYGSTFGEGVAFAPDYIVSSGLFGLVAFARN